MKRIFRAADLAQAYLAAGLLRQGGIEAIVLNQYALGGLGEIPFGEVYPELWVDDAVNVGRVHALLAPLESPEATTASVRCAGCGEENPATFASCWSCGHGLAAQ